MNQTTNLTSLALVALLFLAVGFGIGYSVANSSGGASPIAGSGGTNSGVAATGDGDTPAEVETKNDSEVTTVSANNLTDAQIGLAKAFGVDPNNITITNEMVACAEAKLGVDRVEEIKNGATPSFTEGVTLAACYSGG